MEDKKVKTFPGENLQPVSFLVFSRQPGRGRIVRPPNGTMVVLAIKINIVCIVLYRIMHETSLT